MIALLLSRLTTNATSASSSWGGTRSVSSSGSSCDAVGIDLAASSDNLAVGTLVWIGWNLDIPDTDGAVHATGGEDCRLDAERQRPDTALAMATAALDLRALCQVPKDDGTAGISRSQDLAVGRALKSSNGVGVAVEDTDALASSDGPHANCLVDLIGCGEDVGTVWVPCDKVDGGVVADHHTDVGDVVLGPDTDCLVPTAGSEVVAEWSPLDVPDWSLMSLINNEAGEAVEGPETDGLIGGRGEEESWGGRWCVLRWVLTAFDGWGEGDGVDGGGMSNKAAGGGRRCALWIIERGCQWLAVDVPDADVGLLGADGDKVVVIRELDAGNTKSS